MIYPEIRIGITFREDVAVMSDKGQNSALFPASVSHCYQVLEEVTRQFAGHSRGRMQTAPDLEPYMESVRLADAALDIGLRIVIGDWTFLLLNIIEP
jgi:hypothetical protein